MTSLREAVARAICEEEWNGTQHWDHKPEGFKKCYRETADAAIAAVLDAMAEPSEGMLRRIVRGVEDHVSDWATDDSWMAAREIYGDMLAAFREENT